MVGRELGRERGDSGTTHLGLALRDAPCAGCPSGSVVNSCGSEQGQGTNTGCRPHTFSGACCIGRTWSSRGGVSESEHGCEWARAHAFVTRRRLAAGGVLSSGCICGRGLARGASARTTTGRRSEREWAAARLGLEGGRGGLGSNELAGSHLTNAGLWRTTLAQRGRRRLASIGNSSSARRLIVLPPRRPHEHAPCCLALYRVTERPV